MNGVKVDKQLDMLMDLHCNSFIYRSVSMLLIICSPRNYSSLENPCVVGVVGLSVGKWPKFGLNGGLE